MSRFNLEARMLNAELMPFAQTSPGIRCIIANFETAYADSVRAEEACRQIIQDIKDSLK